MAKQAPAPDMVSNLGYIPRLEWYAIYKDGSTLKQYDGEEQIHCSEDIDRKSLRQFVLTDREGNVKFTQRFRPGQQFLYRARTAMRATVGVIDRIHIIGWRLKDQEQVAFVFESDGMVEIGEFARPDDPDYADRPWFYPFKLNDYDLIEVES